MSTFTSYDGTQLTVTVRGAPAEPVVVLPGGPLQPSAYLDDLGGLDAYRELVVLELPRRRVDQLVGDVDALREHLGRDTLDILAHSAGASLALLYAAAHPDRIGKFALITPSCRAVNIPPAPAEQLAVYEQHADEPWYAEAREAMDAWDAGTETAAQRRLACALVYGRWDDAAQEHAAAYNVPPDAHAIYYGDKAFDVDETRTALGKVAGDVLVLVGSADPITPVRLGLELADLFPHAEAVVQPGAGHYPWLDDPQWFTETLGRFLSIP